MPETPVETIRASGVRPSSAAPGVGHDHDRGGAVVERAAVAGGDHAVGPEDRLQLGDRVVRHARAGAVVLADHAAVRGGDRGDLALPEAVGDRLLGQVLRPDTELVELLAVEAAQLREVLRGLAHRDVGVGSDPVLARVVPVLAALGLLLGPGGGFGEERVLGVGDVVGGALAEPRHRLDTGRDEHVALAGPDRVEGHPGGLHGGGAVAGHRGGRHLVHVVEDVDDPAHVEAALAAGQAAAEVEVVDGLPVERRDLVQGRRGRSARRGHRAGSPSGSPCSHARWGSGRRKR